MNEFETLDEIKRLIEKLTMQLSEKDEKIAKLKRDLKELDTKNKQLQGLKNE